MVHELIERCWSDPAFKRQLIECPRPVLVEHGIRLPDAWTLQVHENTSEVMHLVVPIKTQGGDAQLKDMGSSFAALISRAWDDPSFAARLCEDPKGALTELTGIQVPAQIALAIHCDTSQVRHFVIPVDPGSDDLRECNWYAVAGSIMPRRLGR